MTLKVVLFHHSFSFREMYGLHLQDGNQILIFMAVKTSSLMWVMFVVRQHCMKYADHFYPEDGGSMFL
jgi:hypothetical protein